ncbi:hypothetical protein PM082_011965 [Marasmius tenuissimus]|nr:hypothetical protein PM082_011965 [Marasmius tenuissimus]
MAKVKFFQLSLTLVMSDDASNPTLKYGIEGLYPKEIKRKNGSTASALEGDLDFAGTLLLDHIKKKRAIRIPIIQTLHSTQRIRPLSTQIRIRSCTRQIRTRCFNTHQSTVWQSTN